MSRVIYRCVHGRTETLAETTPLGAITSLWRGEGKVGKEGGWWKGGKGGRRGIRQGRRADGREGGRVIGKKEGRRGRKEEKREKRLVGNERM